MYFIQININDRKILFVHTYFIDCVLLEYRSTSFCQAIRMVQCRSIRNGFPMQDELFWHLKKIAERVCVIPFWKACAEGFPRDLHSTSLYTYCAVCVICLIVKVYNCITKRSHLYQIHFVHVPIIIFWTKALNKFINLWNLEYNYILWLLCVVFLRTLTHECRKICYEFSQGDFKYLQKT